MKIRMEKLENLPGSQYLNCNYLQEEPSLFQCPDVYETQIFYQKAKSNVIY